MTPPGTQTDTAASSPLGWEVKALVKGIAALNSLADVPEGLTLAQIAAAPGLSKATAHRMLATLAAVRLVQPAGAGR